MLLAGYALTGAPRLGIPFGIWLAFPREMGLHGLWYGLTVALVYVSAVGVWMGLNADWDQEVKKVQMRLEADKANEEERVGLDGAAENA